MNDYHHGDLKTALLDIAWEAVEKKGARFSLRAIARTAGVDPAAVYRHYPSKEAIVAELSRRAFSEMAQLIETRLDTLELACSRDRLTELGLAYVAYAIRHPRIFEMMFDAAGRLSRDEVRGTAASGRTAYEILRDEVQVATAIPEGSSDLVLTMLWCNVHGLATLLNQKLLPFEQADDLVNVVSRRMVDLLVD